MTDEEMASATFANEFPQLNKQVELDKHLQTQRSSFSASEVKSAYIAGYLRAIKERT